MSMVRLIEELNYDAVSQIDGFLIPSNKMSQLV